MSDKPTIEMDEETRERLAAEAAAAVTAALRILQVVHRGDEKAVKRSMKDIVGAASVERVDEPIVIRVETMGMTDMVTLREYFEVYTQDWDIGLAEAEEVLAEAPRPLVYNQDDAIRHPELLQLHTAIDPDLLESEMNRLARERDSDWENPATR
jgi:hypothetical protein